MNFGLRRRLRRQFVRSRSRLVPSTRRPLGRYCLAHTGSPFRAFRLSAPEQMSEWVDRDAGRDRLAACTHLRRPCCFDRDSTGAARAEEGTPSAARHRSLSYRSARPQRGERLVLRLLAPVSTTIATLIALIKQFDPLEFLGALLKRDPRIAKLRVKLVD
jgi:hypothetical protein